MKETDLFPYLRDYFKDNPKNEIFTEVNSCGGPRPDIVVRNGSIITVVEMKTSLSMKLLEQAFNWRYRANYVFIAIPEPKNRSINRFVLEILRDYGIGLLTIHTMDERHVKEYEEEGISLDTLVGEHHYCKPKLFRNSFNRQGWKLDWNKALKDIYKYENNTEAGNHGGGYNTEYSCMISDVKSYLRRNGNKWTDIKEIIDNIESVGEHYMNPKASIYNALINIEFEEFESTCIHNKTHFRLRQK